ncbi:MAG: pectate lyase [Planctomycetes bacterium]|nr:pectate lyase [Planctomycetota bacterium]
MNRDGIFCVVLLVSWSAGLFAQRGDSSFEKVYATCEGGSGAGLIRGVSTTPGGGVHLVGYARLEDFPVAARALQKKFKAAADTFAVSLSPRRPQRARLEKRSAEQDEALRIAENVLLYQRASGGWPKNYDEKKKLTDAERTAILKDRSKDDAMIDNGATHTEIRLVAEAFRKTRDERFKESALRGIRYLLGGQYAGGGWPQRFPDPTGYARYITFNDNAMIGVISLLRDVARGDEVFSFVPQDVREKCQQAVERGIQCILKCQIRLDGRRAAWCAQHDPETCEPRPARSYELASLSGSESVGIVRFLMQMEEPGDEVIRAIEDAVAWFERSKLEGIKVVRVKDATAPRGYDQVVVEDPDAPPMWARFYDLESGRPIFCSRDGIPRRSLAEISYERRNGYSWLGYYAQGLLEKDYPAWKRRLRRD